MRVPVTTISPRFSCAIAGAAAPAAATRAHDERATHRCRDLLFACHGHVLPRTAVPFATGADANNRMADIECAIAKRRRNCRVNSRAHKALPHKGFDKAPAVRAWNPHVRIQRRCNSLRRRSCHASPLRNAIAQWMNALSRNDATLERLLHCRMTARLGSGTFMAAGGSKRLRVLVIDGDDVARRMLPPAA